MTGAPDHLTATERAALDAAVSFVEATGPDSDAWGKWESLKAACAALAAEREPKPVDPVDPAMIGSDLLDAIDGRNYGRVGTILCDTIRALSQREGGGA